jgi:hypothetical protein
MLSPQSSDVQHSSQQSLGGCHQIRLHAPGVRPADLPESRLDTIPAIYLAKGNITLTGPLPFSRLIYPVPTPRGLGIPLAMTAPAMPASIQRGMDRQIDYSVDPARAVFRRTFRRGPELKDGQLQPGYCAIEQARFSFCHMAELIDDQPINGTVSTPQRGGGLHRRARR